MKTRMSVRIAAPLLVVEEVPEDGWIDLGVEE
jgi:hypothetical protein